MNVLTLKQEIHLLIDSIGDSEILLTVKRLTVLLLSKQIAEPPLNK